MQDPQTPPPELLFRRDRGWSNEYSLPEALRVTFQRADDPQDSLEAIAQVMAHLLRKLPPEEILAALNEPYQEWEIAETTEKP